MCPASPAACCFQVAANAARILAEIGREEAAFSATLSKGQKLLDEMLANALNTAAAAAAGGSAAPVLAGADAFLLYDSFGFPLELTQVRQQQLGRRLGMLSSGLRGCGQSMTEPGRSSWQGIDHSACVYVVCGMGQAGW
jgi:alanyl-tRNA synthetase